MCYADAHLENITRRHVHVPSSLRMFIRIVTDSLLFSLIIFIIYMNIAFLF